MKIGTERKLEDGSKKGEEIVVEDGREERTIERWKEKVGGKEERKVYQKKN